jgi:hypothetical protein
MAMIDYTLAEVLLEHGFPMKKWGDEEVGHSEDPDDCPFYIPYFEANDLNVYYMPTLSDLIEQCGPKFLSLVRQGRYWSAASKTNRHGAGQSPDEACARLWLLLNNK